MLLTLGKRWCAACQSVKDVEEFVKKNHCCKSCHKKKYIAWQEKNSSYFVQYRKSNKEKRKEYNKEWINKNKEKALNYKLNWRALQRKTNPSYRLLNSLRCRLSGALKNNKKLNSTIDLIGCSIQDLKIYLQKQFKEGMCWGNYGNPNKNHSNCWHIDHIAPCSSFDLSDPEQQKKCFHFSNLQPLWAKDNLSKSDSV